MTIAEETGASPAMLTLALDLISTETIIELRDPIKVVKWSKRMKDAG
jgi:hypothetical protein